MIKKVCDVVVYAGLSLLRPLYISSCPTISELNTIPDNLGISKGYLYNTTNADQRCVVYTTLYGGIGYRISNLSNPGLFNYLMSGEIVFI